MTPGKYDLTLYRGDTWKATFNLFTTDDSDVSTPVDLTGATVEAEFRDKPGGATTVALETVVTLPNSIAVELTPELWTGAPNAGAWDLEVTYPSGDVQTVVAGTVKVTADVTNSPVVVRGAR